jgi:hypothetical protein
MKTHTTIEILGLALMCAAASALLGTSEAQGQGRGGGHGGRGGGFSMGRPGGGSAWGRPGGGSAWGRPGGGSSWGKPGGGPSGGRPPGPNALEIMNGVGNMVGTIVSSLPGPSGHHGGHNQHHGGDYSQGYYVYDSDDDEGTVYQTDYTPSVASNPAPAAHITLVNPKKNGVTLQYTLDGEPYSLEPGFKQEVRQVCEIHFDKGDSAGTARYTVSDGTYSFTSVRGAWDLFQEQTEGSQAETSSGLASNPVPAE